MIEAAKKIPGLRRASELPILSRPYHFLMAFLGALRYGFPAYRMKVVGVTGTKGKTSTSNLICHILNYSGRMTGLATTVNFRIGDKEWTNATKQTMLGRFGLQKLLFQMANAGCEYAVVETSSEGILQYRHRFNNYLAAVFTNLTPEHIERHGSFENYRAAKVKLFERVAARRNGIGVYNLDDDNVPYFLKPRVRQKFGFAYKTNSEGASYDVKQYVIKDVEITDDHTSFVLEGVKYEMRLLGEFNVYNAAGAVTTALALGIAPEVIQEALKTARPAPGRLELVDGGQEYKVVVDYAHEPASLEAVYQAAKVFKPKRVIGILGSQGGGRDKWKRAAMGVIAAAHADVLILTNEDPYDEDPARILDDIERGAKDVKDKKTEIIKIIDREEAIKHAISLAGANDLVMITGKGGEVWMCVAGGKKIPWSDKKIAEEAIAGKS